MKGAFFVPDILTKTFTHATAHEEPGLLPAYFRARHDVFIKAAGWDVPHDHEFEFDQYDTMRTVFAAVTDGAGGVLAGFRMTPTTSRLGAYSYMVRDGQAGLLEAGGIPAGILAEAAPVAEDVWECSRAFVVPGLDARTRGAARRAMTEFILPVADLVGAVRLVTLIDPFWKRWAPMHGIRGRAMGPVTPIGGQGCQVVEMSHP